MAEQLRVIHDARGVVAVDKPPGLESTGRTPDDPGGAQHHLQVQLGRKLWLVHQLDRDTSGVLVFVRKKRLVAVWQEALGRSMFGPIIQRACEKAWSDRYESADEMLRALEQIDLDAAERDLQQLSHRLPHEPPVSAARPAEPSPTDTRRAWILLGGIVLVLLVLLVVKKLTG